MSEVVSQTYVFMFLFILSCTYKLWLTPCMTRYISVFCQSHHRQYRRSQTLEFTVTFILGSNIQKVANVGSQSFAVVLWPSVKLKNTRLVCTNNCWLFINQTRFSSKLNIKCDYNLTCCFVLGHVLVTHINSLKTALFKDPVRTAQ